MTSTFSNIEKTLSLLDILLVEWVTTRFLD